jgi:PAS domain S-box-containing protein
MRVELSINKGLFAGILLALLIFSGMWWYSYRQTKEANKTAALIANSEEILYQSTRILATITDNETGARGFVLTGKSEFLEPLEHSKKSIHQQIAALQVMEKDNVGVLNTIDTLLLYIDKRITFSDSMVSVRQARGLSEAAGLVSAGTGKFYLDRIRGLITLIQSDKTGSLEKQKLAITAQLKIEKVTFFALAFIMLGLMIILFVKEKVRVQQRERDRAQLSLAALSMQINESNNAIYTLDAQRKIISWNRGAQHLYGYSAEEAIGKNSNQLLQTKIQPSELNTSIIELARDNYWTGELERITKAGKTVFVNSSTTTIKNIKGFVTGYVVIGIDITAPKKLSRQVNYLASLVEQSTEAIFSRNISLQLTSWNRGAERLFGYTKDEAIGKSISQLGILQLDQDDIDDVQEQISNTGSWEAENIYYCKDGSTFVGAVTGNVIKAEKREDDSFYFIVKDISVQKQFQERLKFYNQELEEKVVARTEKILQNEKRFRALIEHNNDVISLMDASFKIIYRSPSAQRIMGWSDEEMIELHGAANIHPDDQALAGNIIHEVMANPGKTVNTLFRNRHKEGHYIWMEGSVINLLHDDSVNAIVFNYRDVTRRIESEKEIINLNKEKELSYARISDGVISFDNDWRYTFLNDAAAAIPRVIAGEDIHGKFWWEVTPGIRESIYWAKAQEAANSKKIVTFETYYEPFLKWYSCKVYPSSDGVTIFYTDVTDKKNAEEKLIQSEMRFRALIENSAEGIALTDETAQIVYRSPGAQKITGLTMDECAKMSSHPDDAGYMKDKCSEAIGNPGMPVEFQAKFLHNEGHYFWMEGTVTNMLDVPGVNAVVYNYRDISGRKELEDLLLKANKLAQIGGWEIDLKKETIYWSDITREIHETDEDYTPDLETAIHFYKQGQTRDLINQKVKEAIENGKSWDVELPIITAKKNERWVRSIGEAEIINGKCARVYGSFQNIDARKKAQLKLIESEQRFKALVENNYDIITLIDESFNIIYQSPSVSRVTGFSPEEIQVLEGGENIHPADMEYMQKVFQHAAANPGKPVKAMFRTQHKGGQYIWLEGVVTNLLQEESIKAFVTNFRDITDRKEAEEKLKSSEEHYKMLVEQAVDGIFLSDASGKYIDVNTAGCNLLGYTREELTKKTIADIIHEDEIIRLPAEVARFADGDIAVSEWRFKHKDGSGFIGEVIGRSLPDGRLQAILRDVTERREAEEKIKNLNASLEEKILLRTEQLRKSNEELEAFSYSVSHDLRAPLRAIVGYTSILEEDYGTKLDDEGHRITGVIKKNTLKMGNLIDDLLTFSRTGKHELVKTKVSTRRMVEEITNEINHTNNIEHKINWQISELPFVQADLSALRQVWVNLISNAVKYSSKIERPQIEIGSFRQSGLVTFFVKDNGAGFDEKYKNKLFKVFQRLHGSKEFEGTGIGLAIVDKIISRHGGTVRAEGTVDKGACFYFSLPQNE